MSSCFKSISKVYLEDTISFCCSNIWYSNRESCYFYPIWYIRNLRPRSIYSEKSTVNLDTYLCFLLFPDISGGLLCEDYRQAGSLMSQMRLIFPLVFHLWECSTPQEVGSNSHPGNINTSGTFLIC